MGSKGDFEFLATHDPQLARLGTLAERHLHHDAPAALIRLRQLAEFIAKDIAARHALLPSASVSFDDVLRILKMQGGRRMSGVYIANNGEVDRGLYRNS